MKAKIVHYKIMSRQDNRKKGKSTSVQSLPIRGLDYIRIFIFLGRAASCRTFFIRGIVGNILGDVILPHTTLIDEEEHIINLLLILILQLLLMCIEPRTEFLQLILLGIKTRPELLQLFL